MIKRSINISKILLKHLAVLATEEPNAICHQSQTQKRRLKLNTPIEYPKYALLTLHESIIHPLL
jgi:hypothetical protein